MELNEQTELKGKIETYSCLESRMTAGGGSCEGRDEQKGKMTHGHGQ